MNLKSVNNLIRLPYLSSILSLIFSSLYIYVTLDNSHDLLFIYVLNFPGLILSVLLAIGLEFKKKWWVVINFLFTFIVMPFYAYTYSLHYDMKIIFYSFLLFNLISLISYLISFKVKI